MRGEEDIKARIEVLNKRVIDLGDKSVNLLYNKSTKHAIEAVKYVIENLEWVLNDIKGENSSRTSW